ncbi:hypothetical protein SAMN04487825_11153 [Prevotella sp. kh1p2]|nr:hypothetical protein SAMN04487825_11153 [Prevotella sp. kh1p2]SNU11426.1 hypothetical protein SAMN06298210_11054 [Prevotellaceae bacterium KH2P17]
MLALCLLPLYGFGQNTTLERSYRCAAPDKQGTEYTELSACLRVEVKDGRPWVVNLYPQFDKRAAKSLRLWVNSIRMGDLDYWISSLEAIKQKFGEWTAVAAENKVTDYRRNMQTRKIYFPPLFATMVSAAGEICEADKGGVQLVPYFEVDKSGNCCIALRPTPATFVTYDLPDRDTALSNPATTVIAGMAGAYERRVTPPAYALVFASAGQIDSFIEALRFYPELRKLQEAEQTKRNRAKELDKIFK